MKMQSNQLDHELIQEERKENKINFKIPDGTKDFLPHQMVLKKFAFKIITEVFEQHGAVEIDTPILEMKDTLLDKYGEEGGKMIYDLQDQGGEQLSLRYDLTVPFARVIASHGLKKLKRFHIGKVYRRENPSLQFGRFREFFQCDFDIAGENDPMVADAELIKVIDTIFTRLDLGPFQIRISNRKLLEAMIVLAGIQKHQFKTISATIDKFYKFKLHWNEVKQELMEKKGVTIDQAEKLGKMLLLRGEPFKLLKSLKESRIFEQQGKETLQDMELLFNLLKSMNGLKNVIFDLSVARGADYYTGIIQETVLLDGQLGAISGGGRYDDLVGMFSSHSIPCVGAAIGIDRIFSILEQKYIERNLLIKENHSDVIVITMPSKDLDMNHERFKLYDFLWNNKFKADNYHHLNWNIDEQLHYAEMSKIPLAIILKDEDIIKGLVQVRNLKYQEEITVHMEELVEILKQKIVQL